jgi:hypothetical protein
MPGTSNGAETPDEPETSEESETPDGAETSDEPETPDDDACTSETGTGRAALIAIGLSWDQGVFLQPLWQGDELSYLVINNRDEAVDVVARAGNDYCNGEYVSERLAGPWTVAARSHELVTGSEVTALFGRGANWFAGETPLGLDILDQRPSLPAGAAVVSNHGTNGSGGEYRGQIESDFVVAPGPAFTLTVVAPPGELTLTTPATTDLGIPSLDIVAVRSEQASVRQTPTGFSVVIPPPDEAVSPYELPATSDLVRIEVDVAVPQNAGEASGVVFDSWFCSAFAAPGQCAAGNGMVRAFPLSR